MDCLSNCACINCQMGWLDILGTKHQLVLGENKIGRDPATCAVVLSGCLVSMHHADAFFHC